MQRYESIAQMVLPIGSLEAEDTGYKCRSRRHQIGVPTPRHSSTPVPVSTYLISTRESVESVAERNCANVQCKTSRRLLNR